MASFLTGGFFNGIVSAEDNIHLTDAGTIRAKLLLNSSDRDNVELRAESLGSTMKFFTVGTEALLLDSSQNATFSGDVTLAEASNKGQLFFGTANTDYEIKGGGNYGYLSLNAPILRFDTGGSERMRIDSSGNLQFSGATSNTTVLSMNTADGADNKQLSLAGGGADSDGRGARMRMYGNEHATNAGVVDLSTGNIAGSDMHLRAKDLMLLYTGGSERMRITSTGNVGIGTGASTPENKLHVKTNTSDATSAFMVQNGSTGDASIKFNVSGQSYVAGIDYDDSKKFKIAASGNLGTTDRITLLSTGQVGIGTITPGEKLHVAGNTFLSANSAYMASYNNTNSYHGSLVWAGLQLGNNGINRIVAGRTNAGGSFQFWTNNTNNAADYSVTPDGIMTMAMTNAGNVGIGVTPRTISTYKVLDISGSGGSGGYIGLSSGSTQQGELYSHGGGVDLVAIGAKQIRFFTNGSQQAVITSDGKFGIGTTSPTAKLDVNGEIKGASFSGPGQGLSNLLSLGAYQGSPAVGILIATNIVTNNYSFIFGTIKIEQFNFTSKQTIEFSATTNNNGTLITKDATSDVAITFKLFNYSGKWYLWFPMPSTYSTCTAFVNTGAGYQGQSKGFNEVSTVTVSAVPSSGVTNSYDITPKVYLTTSTPGGNLPGGPYLPLTAGSTKPLTGDLYINKSAPALRLNDSGDNVPYELRVDGTTFSIKEVTNSRTLMSMTAGAVITLDSLGSNTIINTVGAMVVPNGKVGIGTASPGAKLNVVGTGTQLGTSGYYYNTFLKDTTNSGVLLGGNNTDNGVGFLAGVNELAFLTFGTSWGERMRINSAGNVGIGTTSPGTLHNTSYGFTRLHIDGGTDRGQMIIEGNNYVAIHLSDNTATANERVFATQVLDGKYQIKPLNDNGTSTVGGEAITVLHNSNVGIGATGPTGKLEVQRSQVTTQFDRDCFLRLHPSATTDAGGFTNMFFGTSTVNNYGVAIGGKREGTGDGEPTFAIRMLDDSITGIEVLNIGSTGAIKFNAYNSTNNTGTPTYLLGTDGSGNIVKTLPQGSGTAGPYLPLAGGTMTGVAGVVFPDAFKLNLGTGSDLEIYHSGSNGFLENNTGGLYIRQQVDNQDVYFQADRGDGNLANYFYLSGTDTNNTDTLGATRFPDKSKIFMGDNKDLQIYHDGTHSFISDQGAGNLTVLASAFVVNNASDTENMIIASSDGSVNLYYDGSQKFRTISTGVAVTGDIKIQAALLSNQDNTDVDTGTETVANVAIATYTAAFFDFVIKKSTNVRSGTVYACHDGTNVQFTETSTQDLGDTSDVTLSVDISGGNMRLRATSLSESWSVKSLIRAI
jgi:hypothetical protein